MKSGTIARCGHCQYEGTVYGTPTSEGVSAPWCPNCQKNDRLKMKEPTNEQINKALAEFDERFKAGWHEVSPFLDSKHLWQCSCQYDQVSDKSYVQRHADSANPDYCSEESPRSLLSGLEKQLTPELYATRYMEELAVACGLLRSMGKVAWRGLIYMSAKDRARAIYEVLKNG